ncbi:MAG: phosphoribosylamine--glycine ligase [Syntrophomonadaceae bacterium]|jgi:phosphoribosylamine--glycine ligase|nr:phosphoribosylamine--glycine ligase [Syntrophomonadaceae bacterium]
MGKKVLVIGAGGREHALVWKLAQSPLIEKIYAAPGNPGIGELAELVNVGADDVEGLLSFAKREAIDLTVVGPEIPLLAGVVDSFAKAGLSIFGPTAAAAQIEASKAFAKKLMRQCNIPTAEFKVFSQIEPAREYARTFTEKGRPVVIKADGLAAGKGVVIAVNTKEAEDVLESMLLRDAFGDAGRTVVVEECLQGEEVSFFVVCNGNDYLPIMSAQDHKRAFDGDQGPNTGGMGAYVNPPVFTDELQQKVEKEIIAPVIKAMKREGIPFCGVLYAGLMITDAGPKVLEFNARFGDPETQVLMPMLESDLFPVLEAAAKGESFAGVKMEIKKGACLGVVLAAGGYPGAFAKGMVISGLESLDRDTLIFHAGTKINEGNLVTSGGRVLAVVCCGSDFKAAALKVYQQIGRVNFENMHYRRDVGERVWKKSAAAGKRRADYGF